MIVFYTSDSTDQVAAFSLARMPANGWSMEETPIPGAEEASQMWTKTGEHQALISWQAMGDKTQITYMVK